MADNEMLSEALEPTVEYDDEAIAAEHRKNKYAEDKRK